MSTKTTSTEIRKRKEREETTSTGNNLQSSDGSESDEGTDPKRVRFESRKEEKSGEGDIQRMPKQAMNAAFGGDLGG
jgi:hypothetical protein